MPPKYKILIDKDEFPVLSFDDGGNLYITIHSKSGEYQIKSYFEFKKDFDSHICLVSSTGSSLPMFQPILARVSPFNTGKVTGVWIRSKDLVIVGLETKSPYEPAEYANFSIEDCGQFFCASSRYITRAFGGPEIIKGLKQNPKTRTEDPNVQYLDE